MESDIEIRTPRARGDETEHGVKYQRSKRAGLRHGLGHVWDHHSYRSMSPRMVTTDGLFTCFRPKRCISPVSLTVKAATHTGELVGLGN